MNDMKMDAIYKKINQQMDAFGVFSLKQIEPSPKEREKLSKLLQFYKPFSVIVDGKERDFYYFLEEEKLYWHLTRFHQPMEVFTRASSLYPKFASYFEERLQKKRMDLLLKKISERELKE